MSARDRILGRIREALRHRERAGHPGAFQGWRPADVAPEAATALDAFEAVFTRSGGEVVRVADETAARRWLDALAQDCDGVVVGETVPPELRPAGVPAAAEEAALGVSMACGAVGETGSLLLDARDGRRTQLLPPTHVVLLRPADVHATLVEALQMLHEDLPSAVGLHSGPSKSADIGQILVRGVHGPGRVIALILEGRSPAVRT